MTALVQRFDTPAIAELRNYRQFVRWKSVRRKGQDTKVPFMADGTTHASSTDPSTWTTLGAIQLALGDEPVGARGGIGFVFTADDEFVGVDLDSCRDSESGRIVPWAQTIIDDLDSYAEVSPSGTGVKVWVKARWPEVTRHKVPLLEMESTVAGKVAAIECYDRERYFTLTGWHLAGTPEQIQDSPSAVNVLYLRFFTFADGHVRAPNTETVTEAASLEEAYAQLVEECQIPSSFGFEENEVIERALRSADRDKFRRLFVDGDTGGYGSTSEADLALVNILLFWVADDLVLLDKLFHRSALFRADKWGARPQYRIDTLWKAAHHSDGSVKTEYYQGSVETGPTIHLGGAAVPSGNGAAAGAEVDHADVDLLQARFTLTDTGNGERLISRHGLDLRYAPENKRWLTWDDTRWATDLGVRVQARAKGTLRSLLAWASRALKAEPPPTSERSEMLEAVRKHAFKSLSAPRVAGMLSMAQSEPGVAVMNAELDNDVLLFNCRNGTLDLRTGELRPHRRQDLLTRRSDVVFDPDAQAPRWEQFLSEVFNADQELIRYVQQASGYALGGDTMARVLFLLHGYGRNGKSTFLDALGAMCGEYATSVPSETLMRKQHVGGSIPNDVASLRSARLVTAIETDEGRSLAEALIKAMTGGTDTLTARFLYGEWFSFRPQFKLWLATNHLPSIEGAGEAIWDRLHLIPFVVRFDETQEDKTLPRKLRQELSGILNWALEGWRMYQDMGGLAMPQTVREATAQFRVESDHFRRFIADRCVLDPKQEARASDLYFEYELWCGREDLKVISTTRFGRRLRELNLTSRLSNGTVWDGIGVKPRGHAHVRR